MATEPNSQHAADVPNPRELDALASLRLSHGEDIPGQAVMWAAHAQTEATLALAYEQRTANLIALLAARTSTGDMRMVPELDGMIEERLGL